MFLLNGAQFGIWASRIPSVADRHDISPGILGLLLLLMAVGAIVAFPLSGLVSDRTGASKIARRAAIGYTAALILVAFSPSFWFLAAALFLFGFGLGGMGVAMNSWAAEVERNSTRPLMSSFHAMFSIGTGSGAGSGFVAASLDLPVQVHFTGAGLIVATISLYFANIAWESQKIDKCEKTPTFSFPRGPLFPVGILAFCATLGEGAMADWSAIFLVTVARVSEASAALGYTVFSIAMIGMRFMGDWVISKSGPVNAARFSGIAAATGAACASGCGTFAMVLLGFGLMGLGYAVIMPLAFSRAANDSLMAPGAAIAAVSTLGFSGILLGPPLVGFVAEVTSIRHAFWILSGLAVVITLLSGALSKR